jgi:hypothetical protein
VNRGGDKSLAAGARRRNCAAHLRFPFRDILSTANKKLRLKEGEKEETRKRKEAEEGAICFFSILFPEKMQTMFSVLFPYGFQALFPPPDGSFAPARCAFPLCFFSLFASGIFACVRYVVLAVLAVLASRGLGFLTRAVIGQIVK